MNSIVKVVKDFLYEYKINTLEDTILLAFSGGFDSMCLLHILKNLGCNNIVAIHLNHNWRGNASKTDEENCRKICKSLGVEFYSEIIDSKIKKTETDARHARYLFYGRCAEKFESNIVFTAHNANDNAETVLYRIIKGTGVNGLAGIQPKRDIFYRPLLKVLRTDIEAYCREKHLSPNIDKSNSDTKYKRNFIRHNIIPMMESINPDAVASINSLSEISKEYSSFVMNSTDNGSNSTMQFLKLHDISRFYVLKDLLTEYGLDYDKEKINNLKTFIINSSKSKSGKKISLSEDLFLYVNSDYYKVVKYEDKNLHEVPVTETGKYEFGDYVFVIEECHKQPKTFPKDFEKKAYVNLNNLNLTIRTRRDGDIIQPLGLKGSQKLKKYLNEKKIPEYEKDKILLLCSGKNVLWAAGYGLSELIKVIDNPTHVVYLKERL